jgi:ParB/RepB/Spo0J family partition protein
MNISKTKIPDDVRAIIARSAIVGSTLTLPEQLDRDTYVRVDKVLKAVGGKWDRKARNHSFSFDPRELIETAIDAGAYIDRKKTLQFFQTPHDLARRMVEEAEITSGDDVLEPSAGHGGILHHILATDAARIDCVEIDAQNGKVLRLFPAEDRLAIHDMAFEEYQETTSRRYDAIVMNPPFANGQDVAHIQGAWGMLKPGGRLVAICSEGPFFYDSKAGRDFRAWLDEISADVEQLASGTFKESGTMVATRLIVAKSPRILSEPDAPELMVRNLPIGLIRADPDQPRKVFEPNALRELAASIAADGLLQPITVRAMRDGKFMIVAGERRFRACQLNGRRTIRALVIEVRDETDIRVKQILENDQRVDVTPLEQARSYASLMESSGMTAEQLAKRIGKSVYRITERTVLLTLRPEHQALLASGNLKPSEATEMARLSPRGQDVLFNLIRTGKCPTYNDVRARANSLLAAQENLALFDDEAAAPTPQETSDARAFEAMIEKVASLLRAGIQDNKVVAVKRINRNRADYLADLLAVMAKDVRRIELSLRDVAVQAEFAAALV